MRKTDFLVLIFMIFLPLLSWGQKLTMRGYIKEIPMVQFDRDFSNAYFENIIHNRLNFRYFPTEKITFAAEGRTRLFYGETYREKLVKYYLEADDGAIDFSKVVFQEGAWLFHTHLDRLYADFRIDKLQVRAGRQRINWGINLVSNPNDLFNTYSFFDFDYEERPGADALRVQYFLGSLARIEGAVKAGATSQDHVAALLWGFNVNRYDLQVIWGYYREKIAVGGGWAGNIKSSGFKGEITVFNSLDKFQNEQDIDIVAAVSADYLFKNSLFIVGEVLYNSSGSDRIDDLFLLTEPLSADNLSLARYQLMLQASYPFSPVLNGSLATLIYPTDGSFFLMPNISWSVKQNIDVTFLTQYFGGKGSSLLTQAGARGVVMGRWSF